VIPSDKATVIKRGSHTAICLGKKRKFWYLIPMSNAMLRVVRRTDFQLESDRWQPLDYDVRKVAAQYLKHGAGCGPVVIRLLTQLVASPNQLEIDLTDDQLTTDRAQRCIAKCRAILQGATA